MIIVSVIVACRNEASCIGRFLDSLCAQQVVDGHWEAIVADGMSDDGTRGILAEYRCRDPRLRVIDNPGRIVATGLNACIRAARGRIVVRMDAHTVYAPDYIHQCVAALRRTGADNVGGPARTLADGYWPRAIAAGYHSPFSCGGARFHDERFEGYVDTVPYGCWRKSTLVRLGMFDPALLRNQDDELNLRIVRGGGKIWQDPAIVSWYRPRGRLPALFRQYFQYGFWKVAVIRKHRLPASWRHLVPAAFVFAFCLLLVAGAAAVLAGNAAAARVALALFSLQVASYGAVSLLAALAAAGRHGWSLLPALPLVFATCHCSYGLGFLFGILCRAGTHPSPQGALFTQLSR